MSISKVLLVSLASTLFVHHAQADQKRFIFDIRNQSLSQALLRLAQMTGIQLLYISDIAQNVRAPSLIGIYSAEEALPILLQDSNLEAIFINENTIIVKGPTPQDEAQIAALGLSDNFGDHEVDAIQEFHEITGADRYKFMEEIITTGQLVKYPDFHSSSPTIALHYQNFSSNGDLTNDEILNVLPQIIPTNAASSTVNLRHLGISRPLVLLNGRRLPGANMSGYADISMIPSSLIDRIDIVTGGASAIYGSGAIAGVVNFIHDNHAKGLNVRAIFLCLQNITNGAATPKATAIYRKIAPMFLTARLSRPAPIQYPADDIPIAARAKTSLLMQYHLISCLGSRRISPSRIMAI